MQPMGLPSCAVCRLVYDKDNERRLRATARTSQWQLSPFYSALLRRLFPHKK